MNPKISVIIPVYNVAKYIESCIDSVLAQTETDFEIIVIDDESPDNSIDIINDKYSDARIKIIKQANRGLAGARNTGIRNASGEYIALLDSDDIWTPDKLELQLKIFTDPKVGIVYNQSQFMDDDGNKINLLQEPKLDNIEFKDVICRNPIGNGSVPMFRKQVFDDIATLDNLYGVEELFYFDDNFKQSEDIECWIRIAATTNWKFKGIAKPLTWYRINSVGLSANLDAQYASWLKAIDKAREYAPELINQWESLAKAYQLRYLSRRAVQTRNPRSALKLIIQALSSNKKLLLEEPKKTVVTLAAAILINVLPLKFYENIEQKIISNKAAK